MKFWTVFFYLKIYELIWTLVFMLKITTNNNSKIEDDKNDELYNKKVYVGGSLVEKV